MDLSEKYEELKKLGVEVFSVSTDTHFSHKAWHDTSDSIKKIKYPMLADPTGALSRALGVYIEEEGMATVELSLWTLMEKLNSLKFKTTELDEMQMNYSVKSKLLSSFVITRMKYVQRSGNQGRKRLNLG